MKTVIHEEYIQPVEWEKKIKTKNIQEIKTQETVLYEEWVQSICSQLPLTVSLNQHHLPPSVCLCTHICIYIDS